MHAFTAASRLARACCRSDPRVENLLEGLAHKPRGLQTGGGAPQEVKTAVRGHSRSALGALVWNPSSWLRGHSALTQAAGFASMSLQACMRRCRAAWAQAVGLQRLKRAWLIHPLALHRRWLP